MTFHCNVSNIKSSVIFKVNAYVNYGDVMTLMGKWIFYWSVFLLFL